MAHIAHDTYELGKLQSIFSFITVIFLIASIIYAGLSAKAAQDSATSARAQIAVAERNAKLESRAYVHVEKVDMLYLDSDVWQPNIRIRIKNYGATPAHRVNHKCSFALSFNGVPGFQTLQENDRYATLGPSQDYTSTMLVPRRDWDNSHKPRIIKK